MFSRSCACCSSVALLMDGGVVRATKSEILETDEKREAAIRLYEMWYRPTYGSLPFKIVYSLVGLSSIARADMADRTAFVCILHVTSEASERDEGSVNGSAPDEAV